MSKQDFEVITCALANDAHFSLEPIILSSCSHSVCKICLQLNENKNEEKEVDCLICNKTTKIDSINRIESLQTKKLIKVFLEDLYKLTEKRIDEIIEKKKDIEISLNENTASNIQYIEDEVEIQIESVKSQLDEAFIEFKDNLQIIKNDLLNPIDRRKYYEIMYNQLKKDHFIDRSQNENEFYKLQNIYVLLNTEVKRLEKYQYQLTFNQCTEKINLKNTIGEINYMNSLNCLKPSVTSTIVTFDDYGRKKGTFRIKLNEIKKFEASKNALQNKDYILNNLKWRVFCRNNQENDNLSICLFCESSAKLKSENQLVIKALVEYRLLHQTDPQKNYSKNLKEEFKTDGNGWVIQFYSFKDLFDSKNGFYNVIDDSITVEVMIDTETNLNK